MSSDKTDDLCELEDVPVLELTGQVDFRNVTAIREKLLSLVEVHKSACVSAGGVDFIDSSGLSALIDAARLAIQLDGKLWLAKPTEQMIHTLSVSGFLDFFGVGRPPFPARRPPVERAPLLIHVIEKTFTMFCCPETLAVVRTKVAEIALKLPFDEDQISDIRLAVGEALSNAYRHGCTGPQEVIAVVCRATRKGLEIKVRDRGDGFDPDGLTVQDPASLVAGGRGIYFMRAMMDAVSFDSGPDGTLVTMFKGLREQSEDRQNAEYI